MAMRFSQSQPRMSPTSKSDHLLSPSQLENGVSACPSASSSNGPSGGSSSGSSWLTSLLALITKNKPVNHLDLVIKLTLLTNITIVLTMTAIAISTHSLALLSSLVENMVDLFVQGMLWYAASCFGKKQDHAKFPAGTSRFEPVTVIVAASIMALVALTIIRESAGRLIKGIQSDEPEVPTLSVTAVSISATSIAVKVVLVVYGNWVLRTVGFSGAVDAVRQDTRNDVISNSFALLSYVLAAVESKLWFLDSAGAMLIFLVIMMEWFKTAREQVMQLVGVCASNEFITEVRDLCNRHHPLMQLDVLRAYHFGNRYLVEIEVILPPSMSVKDAHEIAIKLQFKVEQLCDVERAFVHVDYQTHTYDEHIVSREEDALLVYTGGNASSGATPTLAYDSSRDQALNRLEPPSLRVSFASSLSVQDEENCSTPVGSVSSAVASKCV